MARNARPRRLIVSLVRSSAASAAVLLLAAWPALAAPSVDPVTDAMESNAPEIENSKFQFEGEVNANAVYVRSGPSDNDYPTQKLDRGAKVTVVGIRFDWLKVLPPEGSFCYVAKAYVEKRGDGTVGRVTNTLNVRVGSNLVPMKTKVAARLEPRQEVRILGEQDEYFKIEPPAGVFFFINKQFVDPVRRVEVPTLTKADPSPDTGTAQAAAPVAGATPPAETQPPQPEVAKTETPAGPTAPTALPEPAPTSALEPAPAVALNDASNNAAAVTDIPAGANAMTVPAPSEATAPTTQPGAVALDAGPADGPATQPAVAALSPDIEFDRLEAEIRQAAKLPIEQQPIPELLAGYRKVAAAPELPESMRRIAEHRVQTLEVHNQNRELILAHQRDQADKEAKRLALKAEQEELMERMKSTGIVFYAAVGTLRPSNLQLPSPDGSTLYRLTDPMTGRTVMYIRSVDPNTSRMVGLFVGVQGEVTSDEAMQLRYIAPSEIEPVDQRNVNRSVAARIVPPSLMPGGALAETGTGEVNR